MWAFFVGDFMAIQTINLTVPGGDTPRSANTKINANFSDQNNAASRLVGPAEGNVMEVGAFGLGTTNAAPYIADTTTLKDIPSGFFTYTDGSTQLPAKMGAYDAFGMRFPGRGVGYGAALFIPYYTASSNQICLRSFSETNYSDFYFWTDRNASKDPNGFLKGASPIAEIYSEKMDLNHDATQQGGITFEKLGVGDYLVKGSLGFAQEGWYIETPKDANGNVLVAVVYEQLANNDLSIKTYAKRFDDETGDIVANLTKPRDIPVGRFISLRLHELPKEAPVMPTQNTSADATAQPTNP